MALPAPDAPARGAAPVDETALLEAYFDRLWPLLRSITGAGVRASHDILSELIPLERLEISSGTRVFDWEVPREWVVREAYVEAPDGRRLFDVREHTLHLLNYSAPFQGTVSRDELDAHLHSLPEQPDAIPYVTSYYAERWGFCCRHRDREALPEGDYRVVIDTELKPGSMTLGEAVLGGESEREVLLSCCTCHPSMANNELSGPLVASQLYRRLAAWPDRRLTYRFVFLPETIGSIAYLAMRGEHLRDTLVGGYVVNCTGLPCDFTFKRSRQGDSPADKAALAALTALAPDRFEDQAFRPDRGGDERQYNAPGFDLPVAVMMRGASSCYPEYNTSLDDKSLVSFPAMKEAIDVYEEACLGLDRNRRYCNLKPFGEPQLGKYGLYGTLGDRRRPHDRSALMWLLNYADGRHDLLDIAAKSGLAPSLLDAAARRLLEAGLLSPADDGPLDRLERALAR